MEVKNENLIMDESSYEPPLNILMKDWTEDRKKEFFDLVFGGWTNDEETSCNDLNLVDHDG